MGCVAVTLNDIIGGVSVAGFDLKVPTAFANQMQWHQC